MGQIIEFAAYRRKRQALSDCAQLSFSGQCNFGGLPAHDFKPGDKFTVSGLRPDESPWSKPCLWQFIDD